MTGQQETEDWGPLSGLPGNPIMWVLIASELVVFGAIFIGFSIARLNEPEVFAQAQNHLDRPAGAINTMVLLTSGLFAALAVRFQIDNQTIRTRLAIAAATVFGIVFLAVKFIEYADKFEAGISTETNTFFMFYFLATGFHAMHVVFGIVILIIVGWKNSVENIVTGTAFWHMVDLIWVILFPLIYLVR
jgi:nitric oxide reductase NorE protein